MHRSVRILVTSAIFAVALTGCQNHHVKVDELQKEHDRLNQQYRKDCGGEYLKAKPQFSQKCIDEAKQMDDTWKQLQQEKAK